MDALSLVISHSTDDLRCSEQGSSRLGYEVLEAEHSANAIWSSEDVTHVDEPGTPESWSSALDHDFVTSLRSEGTSYIDEPGTSVSWSTALDDNFVVSPRTEETKQNDDPCIEGDVLKLDSPLALIASESKDRTHDNSIDLSESGERRTKTLTQDRVVMVEKNTGYRGRGVKCSSRFPTEIYELIIDYIAEKSGFYEMGNIARCARVCRAWVPRAQMHLFSAIDLSIVEHAALAGFRDTVRKKPFLLRYIKVLYISNDEMPQQTTILSSYHMPCLKVCSITWLDLATVHPSLYRFPSSAPSLQILSLSFCKSRYINQLCRFFTSFRSLSILTIRLNWNGAPGGHDLPHLQFNLSKCSLQILVLEAKPYLPLLLKSFIKVPPFVSHLRHLIVAYSDHFISPIPLRDITELLEHCSQSLEELTVIFGTWRAYFEYSLPSISPLVYSNISGKESKLFTDQVWCLDDILSRERFCSFRKLRIRVKAEPIEFPKLKERKVDVDFSDKDDPIPL